MTKKIDYIFAAAPEQLINDTNVMDGAFRFWCALYVRDFKRDLEHEIPDIAKAMKTSPRTIYRWLADLQENGWIDWKRNRPGAPERFQLISRPGERHESGTLARLVEYLSGKEATIEGAKELLEIDHFVNSDKNGKTCDKNGTENDHSGNPCDHFVTPFDNMINPAPHAAQPNAPDSPRPSHESYERDHKSYETPTPTVDVDDFSSFAVWLVEQGASAASARRHQHHDEQAARAEWHQHITASTRAERDKQIGTLFRRWEVRPPQPTPPSADVQRDTQQGSADSALYDRARDICPEGASGQDFQFLLMSLAQGADAQQALTDLETRRSGRRERVYGN